MSQPEREARMLAAFAAGRSANDVAADEGLSVSHANRLRWELRQKGHVFPRAKTAPPTLGQGSKKMRSRLATELDKIRRKHTPAEIAIITGIAKKDQQAAVTRPYDYDWKLSHIQRVLDYRGIKMEDFLGSL